MVKALFPIGKTQWAKWGDEARDAYNRMRQKGYTHETAVAEANEVQAKVRSAALAELAVLGQEQEELMPQPEVERPTLKKAPPNLKPRVIKRKQGK